MENQNKLRPEEVVHLNSFVCRDYQLPIVDALENKGYKRVVAVMPRRCLSGNTHITMSNGSFKLLKNIIIGDEILSWNGTSFEPDIVEEKWSTGIKRAVILKAASYKPSIVSMDHKFAYVKKHNKENYDWNTLRDVISSSENHVLQYAGHSVNNHHWIGDFAMRKAMKAGTKFKKLSENYQPMFKEEFWDYDCNQIRIFLATVAARCGVFSNYYYGSKQITSFTLNVGKYESDAWNIYWLFRKVGIVPIIPVRTKCFGSWKIKIGKLDYIEWLLNPLYCSSHKESYSVVKKTMEKITILPKNKHLGCFVTKPKLDRSYSIQQLYDIRTKKNHNFIADGFVVHNSGKDIVAFNLCIRAALRNPCVIYYVFPTYSQAKKVIWDSVTSEGKRILDYVPDSLVESMNSQEMKIRLTNGSLIQLVGSDNVDRLVGTNPSGLVFSEYALQDPRAYQYLRPILAANDGWALFISTPRSKLNHLYHIYTVAKNDPNWFAYKLTLDDTKHISEDEMQQIRDEGLMSEDLIQQEFFTSWSLGVEGSYYGKYVDKMRLENRITMVPWEPGFKVHTAWDLGVRDSTSIIFFQNIGGTVRIIDHYENCKYGLEHYVKVLSNKPYQYGTHIAPHDIKVKEFGTGVTRLEKARQLGIKFIVAPNLSIVDGIEAVRTMLPKTYIDEQKCKNLISSIEAYRQEYDNKKKVYKNNPLHDKSSHDADAMRYLAISLPKTRDGLSAEDLEKRYNETVYGNNRGSIFDTY